MTFCKEIQKMVDDGFDVGTAKKIQRYVDDGFDVGTAWEMAAIDHGGDVLPHDKDAPGIFETPLEGLPVKKPAADPAIAR